MARRDTKKLGRRARKKRQADHRVQQRSEDDGQVGGLLTGMRRGTQTLVGAGSKPAAPATGVRRVLDLLFWLAVAAVAVYFLVHVFTAHR